MPAMFRLMFNEFGIINKVGAGRPAPPSPGFRSDRGDGGDHHRAHLALGRL